MTTVLLVVGAVLLAAGSGLLMLKLLELDKEDQGQMSEGWRREHRFGKRGERQR